MTRFYATPNADSIVNLTDTVTGYPEWYYWRIAKLIPAIDGNEVLMKQFGNVFMFLSDMDEKVQNFEFLFNLTNSTGGDPPAQSLYNITTMNLLLNASMGAPDIIESAGNFTKPLDLSAF